MPCIVRKAGKLDVSMLPCCVKHWHAVAHFHRGSGKAIVLVPRLGNGLHWYSYAELNDG